MSAGIRVTCPHCLTRLKLKSPDMLGRRMKCPRCRELFDAAEEDEELFQPAALPPQTAPLPPPSGMMQIVPSSVPRRKRRSKRQMNMLVPFIGGSVLTAIVVSAFFVPWWSYIEDINLNPFADTPDAIMTDLLPLFRELGDRLEATQNGESLAETAQKLKQLDQRIVDLYLRAVRVSPVSREKIDASSEKHVAGLNEVTRRMEDLFHRAQSRPRGSATTPTAGEIASYEEFKATVLHTTRHLRFIPTTFKSTMERPPAASSKPDKTEVEMISVLRNCAVAISRVDSSSAVLSARSTLEQSQHRMETLKEQMSSDIAGESMEVMKGTFKYESMAQAIRQQIVQVAEVVGERCTLDNDFESALASLCPFENMRQRMAGPRPPISPQLATARPQVPQEDPDSDFNGPVAPPARPRALQKATPAPRINGQASAAPLGTQPGLPNQAGQPFPHPRFTHRRFNQQPLAQQQVPQQPFTHPPIAAAPSLPGGFGGFGRAPLATTIDEPPFVSPVTDEPQGFLAKCKHDFGKDNVVFLGFIDSDIPAAQRKRIQKAVEAVTGKVAARWSVNRGTILSVKTSMETEELASRIVLGRVRKYDVENRRISIDLHAIPMPGRTLMHGFPAQRPLGGNGLPGPRPTVPPQAPIVTPQAPSPAPANPGSNSPRGATGL